MDEERIVDIFSKWSCGLFEYGALGIRDGKCLWSPGHSGGDGQFAMIEISVKDGFDQGKAVDEMKSLIRDLSQQPIPFPNSRYSRIFNRSSKNCDYTFVVGMHHPVFRTFKSFFGSLSVC